MADVKLTATFDRKLTDDEMKKITKPLKADAFLANRLARQAVGKLKA